MNFTDDPDWIEAQFAAEGAAGVCTSGSQGEDYCLHGANLSYALFSGRFAGKSIVDYIGT